MSQHLPLRSDVSLAGPGCARCEQLPEPRPGGGTLYLWFPLGHSRTKAQARLRGAGLDFAAQPGGDGVSVKVDDAALPRALALLDAALLSEERQATRALLVPDGAAPRFEDLPRVTSLTRFAAAERSGWLVEMLRDGRFTSWFQPIVDIHDTRVIYAQEALLRGADRDGAVVPPGRIFQAAHEADLLFQVDLAARLSAIRAGRALPPGQALFVNFTPAALYDPAYCLQRTVRAIDEAGISHDRVVFEVVESGHAQDPTHLLRILDFYRAQGFRVALDDVGAGFSSLNLIHVLRPDLIKIDMGLVRDVHRDAYKSVIASKLLEIAHLLNIPTVAEGIEDADELRWLRAHGARYAQGFAIARPSPSADAAPAQIH